MTRAIFLIFAAFCIFPNIRGQTVAPNFEVPPTNPKAVVQQKLAATDIDVVYSRPSVKGRTIFGELVPYDEVWRTGSDASTKISFSTPVMINGQPLDSGTYELFTIPGLSNWTVIFQTNNSQWGSYSYNQSNDVMRTKVKPEIQGDITESFTIGFENVTANDLTLAISWEDVKVPVPISVDLKETVVPQIEALLKQEEGRKPFFLAAMFYFENDLDINRAAELMAKALEQNPNHLGMLYRQALILEKKGEIREAIEASELSLKLAKTNAPPELRDEYMKLNESLLLRLRE